MKLMFYHSRLPRYLEFTGKTATPERAFANYMRTGGFPESVESYAYEYLKTVF